jgi:hypothetical protein
LLIAASFFLNIKIFFCLIFQSLVDKIVLERRDGGLKYVLSTQVGEGPEVLSDQPEHPVHLLDNLGLPKNNKSA